MGDLDNLIELYLPTAAGYIQKINEIALYLQEQSQIDLTKKMNAYPKKRYWKITGNTRASIKTDFILNGSIAEIRGYIDEGTSPYGPFVDKGHHSWEGYEFLKGGLDETLKRYGD